MSISLDQFVPEESPERYRESIPTQNQNERIVKKINKR